MDPVNQFFSPYIGIGNNPINMIDPNGMTARLDPWDFKDYEDYLDYRRGMNYRETMTYYYGENGFFFRGCAPGAWYNGFGNSISGGEGMRNPGLNYNELMQWKFELALNQAVSLGSGEVGLHNLGIYLKTGRIAYGYAEEGTIDWIEGPSGNRYYYQKSEGVGGSGDWTKAALSFAGIAIVADGPLPFGDALAAAIGTVVLAKMAYDAILGNSNYPGPWIPTYRPPSLDPINNSMRGYSGDEFHLPPGGPGPLWYFIGGATAASMIYDWDKFIQESVDAYPTVHPADNTRVEIKPYYFHYYP